jgi:hypothetical protein
LGDGVVRGWGCGSNGTLPGLYRFRGSPGAQESRCQYHPNLSPMSIHGLGDGNRHATRRHSPNARTPDEVSFEGRNFCVGRCTYVSQPLVLGCYTQLLCLHAKLRLPSPRQQHSPVALGSCVALEVVS